MPKHAMIDGSKNDIRVLCTGPTDSDDAGYVEGVPIDPPDDSPGWQLVDLWVEHDTVQEKGEKDTLTTRKVNPAYYQLWSRPKPKAAKAAKPVKPPKPPKTQRKPRERQAKPPDDKQQTLPKTGDEEQPEAPGTN